MSAFLLSLGYFILLSAKTHTWVFGSGDSSGYLAAVRSWQIVPQWGAPLYVLLGQIVKLFPVDLSLGLTIFLSCFPAALTIYVVTKKSGWIAGLITASSAVFITESTILRNYAPALFFIVLAYYSTGWKRYAMMGISICFHPMALAITALWLFSDFLSRELKWKNIIALAGALTPFALIPIQMSLDIPRLITGPLSINSIITYFFNGATATAFKIAPDDLPIRLLDFLKVLIPSIGIVIIPFVRNIRRSDKYLLIALIFPILYYLLNIDKTTWTYLRFSIPFFALVAAEGIRRIDKQVVTIGCLILILTNGYFINADRLTKEQPMAKIVHDELMNLPDGSVVMSVIGSSYLEEVNVISEGKNISLIPVPKSNQFTYDYIKQTRGLEGNNEIELAESAMNKGIGVYLEWESANLSEAQWPNWWKVKPVLQGNGYVVQVIGFIPR